MITAAKANTNAQRSVIYGFMFNPKLTMSRLYNDLAPRYKDRDGGYTRLLHLEPRMWDSAPMAVLEMVGGKKDLRFYLTAKAIARAESIGKPVLDKATILNRNKIHSNIENGAELLREKVELMKRVYFSETSTPAAELEAIAREKKAELEAEAETARQEEIAKYKRIAEARNNTLWANLRRAQPENIAAQELRERRVAEKKIARNLQAKAVAEKQKRKESWEADEPVRTAIREQKLAQKNANSKEYHEQRRQKWLQHVLKEEGEAAYIQKERESRLKY